VRIKGPLPQSGFVITFREDTSRTHTHRPFYQVLQQDIPESSPCTIYFYLRLGRLQDSTTISHRSLPSNSTMKYLNRSCVSLEGDMCKPWNARSTLHGLEVLGKVPEEGKRYVMGQEATSLVDVWEDKSSCG